jgi:hypothetical protein
MRRSAFLAHDAEIPREKGVFFSRISRGILAHGRPFRGNKG